MTSVNMAEMAKRRADDYNNNRREIEYTKTIDMIESASNSGEYSIKIKLFYTETQKWLESEGFMIEATEEQDMFYVDWEGPDGFQIVCRKDK